MAAGRYDLSIEQGATYSLKITAMYQGGLPIDLAPWSMRMQIRPTHNGPLTLSLTDPSYFTDIDELAGIFWLYIGATITKTLAAGRYVYDLELYKVGDPDAVIRLIEGYATVRPEVTQL